MNNIEIELKDRIMVLEKEKEELSNMVNEWKEMHDDKEKELQDYKNAIKDIEFITNNI